MEPQPLTEPTNSDRTKYRTKCARETTADADLAAVIDAWPTLPGAVKAGVLAMVTHASNDDTAPR